MIYYFEELTLLTMFFAAHWWESFGSQTPQLQKFAIRVLSQTCSSSGCERNWSVFERIHTRKRNRLEQKRLNDLVFVQYNLRLRRNQLLNKRPDSDPIVLDDVDPNSDWVVETHPPEFDVDFDLELDMDIETGNFQIDADPLLGVHGQIPVSDTAGPSGTASRSRRIGIPRVPRRTRHTEAAGTDVPDDDEAEFESESETDDDADIVEGEDAHSSSDD